MIFDYKGWNAVLRALGLPRIVQPIIFDDDGSLPPLIGGGGGESADHKYLKKYIASHPKVLNLPHIKGLKGKTERGFVCADRVDVFFDHPTKPLAVECKTSSASNGELTSGIFQCVKYKALLEAEQKVKGKNKVTPESILVVGRVLPNGHKRLAKLLGVKWVLVTQHI